MNTQNKTQGSGRGNNLTDADRKKGGQHSHQTAGGGHQNATTKDKSAKTSK